MTLSPEDAELFFALWFPLLDYVNTQEQVNPQLKKVERNAPGMTLQVLNDIAAALWNKIELLDSYLDSHAELPEEHRRILSGFRRFVRGNFLIERHLKKGSVFISYNKNNENVYSVIGIHSPLDELFPSYVLPQMIETSLLPWRDKIITDGLISGFRVSFGPGARSSFKEQYLEAKRAGNIITSL